LARIDSGPPLRVLVLERNGDLAARIRHNGVGAGAVVKACPDATRAEAQLTAGHWDVVVAGPSLMHGAGLRRLASLHQRYPWVSVLLALRERPRADLAEIVQVGADDLVPLHADDDELRRSIARAAGITRGRIGLMAHGAEMRSRGRIVMVSSASGGCGKTFLATNAAEFLARTTDQPVVLLDLDLQFGEVSTALRLRPELTITDALAAEAEGHDLDVILDEYLLPHPDGFKVLAAPRLPAEADSVTPGDITRILDVLRARGAWVVIDTHEGLSDLFVAALEATDHVFAVATPDRPSLVNLGRYLGALERLGMTTGNISVVLNKAEDTGLDPADMALQLGRRFAAIVPYSRDVPRSINVGVPLIVGKPKSRMATSLTNALSAVLPGSRTAEPEPVRAVQRSVVVEVVELPEPAVVLPAPEPPPPDDVVVEDEPTEIDLSEPLPRHCPPPVRERPRQGCRRLPEHSPRHCRDRGPPRPRGPCQSTCSFHLERRAGAASSPGCSPRPPLSI